MSDTPSDLSSTNLADTLGHDAHTIRHTSSHTSGVGFRNEIVSVDSLPRLDDSAFEPLDPNHLRVQEISWLITGAVLLTVGVVLPLALDAPRWVLALTTVPVILLVIVGILAERAAFAQRGWLLRTHDISSRQGLIERTTTTAPFFRVQHVTVESGPVARLFGLAELTVFTAGAGLGDLSIPGLPEAVAAQLKETVLARAGTGAESA